MITTIILFIVGAVIGWFISAEMLRRRELRACRHASAYLDTLQKISDKEEALHRSLKSGAKDAPPGGSE